MSEGGLTLGLCDGPLDPLCDAAGDVAESASQVASNAVLGGLGASFVSGAETMATTAFGAIEATTHVDLSATWFRDNVAILAAVALPVVVGLFVLQVLTSVLRREPAGLGRAVVGAGKAMVGAALAISVTQLALVAVDELSAGIAAASGTTVQGAAERFFQLSWLAGPQAGPVLQILFGAAVIIGSMLLWGVLLFRKAALLLIAVFAPVAFAGSAWDQTRVWARRWIEIVAALVLSKLVIVVVFVVGASAFGTDGRSSEGATADSVPLATSMSDLLVGLMLLSIAVLAPWLSWRFVHWTGMEAASVMNGAVSASPIPAAARGSMGTARFITQSAASSAVLGAASSALKRGSGSRGAGSAGGAAAPPPTPPPPPVSQPGGVR